jgi:hypothetical protein
MTQDCPKRTSARKVFTDNRRDAQLNLVRKSSK